MQYYPIAVLEREWVNRQWVLCLMALTLVLPIVNQARNHRILILVRTPLMSTKQRPKDPVEHVRKQFK